MEMTHKYIKFQENIFDQIKQWKMAKKWEFWPISWPGLHFNATRRELAPVSEFNDVRLYPQ